MKSLHEKLICPHQHSIRFGGRRRQCIACKTTWRVWQRKRGRKSLRIDHNILTRYLDGDFVSIRKEAKRRNVHEDVLRRRIKRSARRFIADAASKPPVSQTPCILLADAIIKYIRHEWWTVYLTAVTIPGSNTATMLHPMVRKGKEDYQGWIAMLDALPPSLHTIIVVLVCDGHRALVYYARSHRWLIQRCHAHVLRALSGRRSHLPWSRHRKEGQQLRHLALTILTTSDPQKLSCAIMDIEAMGWDTHSPILQKVINGFVNAVDDYRTYRTHPEFHIPTTNNAMESFISQFQELYHRARGFSSSAALAEWIVAFVKHKRFITCNGTHQPNYRH